MTAPTRARARDAARRRPTLGAWRRRTASAARRSRLATVGLAIIAAFILMAAIGPFVAPYDPSATSTAALQPPSADHLLGTTQTGQDVLSQLLVGTAPSLELGFLASAFATVLAIVVGVASGYLGGSSGESLSALANVFLVIPALPLVIVVVAYLPGRGLLALALVIGLTGWAWGARQLRVQTLSLRNRDDVLAARAIGEKTWRIMFVEMMPGLLPIVISGFLFTTVFAIVTQAALAFLGLTDISSWNWGTMLYWTQNDQAYTLGAWWWYVPPGLCIALIGMGLGLVNFGIDELINPRLRVERPVRGRGRNTRTSRSRPSPGARGSGSPQATERQQHPIWRARAGTDHSSIPGGEDRK